MKDKNQNTQTTLNDKDLRNDKACKDTSSKVSIASHRSRKIRKLSTKFGKQGQGTEEVRRILIDTPIEYSHNFITKVFIIEMEMKNYLIFIETIYKNSKTWLLEQST